MGKEYQDNKAGKPPRPSGGKPFNKGKPRMGSKVVVKPHRLPGIYVLNMGK